MPEMRHDPIQKRWVVIASERGSRPSDFPVPPAGDPPEVDPFSEGNESLTPPEVYAVRSKGSKANGPGWKVRVVPNKFPILKIEGDLERNAVGLYDRMNGVGAHEVVIETPDPNGDLPLLEPEHAYEVVKAFRERLNDLMGDKRFRYVLVFRNHGEFAGSSIYHPHSQIAAMPVTPLIIAQELESAKQHFILKERCLFCDLLSQELLENRRIITQNDDFLAYAPYASRFPFEICLLSKKHTHDFRLISDNELITFTALLQEVLQRLNIGLKDPPYNMILHTSPNTESFTPRPTHWATIQYDWHWHVEIIPRLSDVAGFEWGSGIFINPTPPEQAAELLRGVVLE